MPDFEPQPININNNGAAKKQQRASPGDFNLSSTCSDQSRLDYCRRYAKIVGHNMARKRFGVKYLSAFEVIFETYSFLKFISLCIIDFHFTVKMTLFSKIYSILFQSSISPLHFDR